eukprot:TRINITY_DN26920_c0_g1_i2.p1 TRINITY_DN26920_c0_g1~~TRINITY_DN26920_c0_g1_i2.p1  ORF type:complete len:134 (+),score=8.63 TRINITY_DN26920_c0_g1_i2:748-1149(+)
MSRRIRGRAVAALIGLRRRESLRLVVATWACIATKPSCSREYEVMQHATPQRAPEVGSEGATPPLTTYGGATESRAAFKAVASGGGVASLAVERGERFGGQLQPQSTRASVDEKGSSCHPFQPLVGLDDVRLA